MTFVSVVPRRTPSALLALVVGLGAALAALTVSAAPAQAGDTTTLLAVAAPGQTLDHPAVLTTYTGGGTDIAVWTQQSTVGGTVVRTPQVRRSPASNGAWTPVALPLAGLDSVGEPFLVQDPATGRVLLTASAQQNSAVGATLGTYLWWTADEGVTWNGPTRVYTGFGVGDAAPDGAGGFWTTTGQSGAYITHVTAAYTPEAQLQLTDRVGSRGAIALATGGPGATPVLAFQAGETGLWAHHGTTSSQAQDTLLFPTGDGLNVGVAGNATGVRVAGLHAAGGTSKALFARTIDPATGAATPEQRVSPADAVFFGFRTLAGNPFYDAVAVWNDAAGDVYTTQAGIGRDTWAPPAKVLSGSASGIAYISKPDVSAHAVIGLGNRASDSAPVVWVTSNSRVTEKPTLKSKGAAAYSAAKRSITLKLAVGGPGKVTARVVVSGVGAKSLRSTSKFTVKAAGTVKQKLKLSKVLAAQLAKHPKAKIVVKLTIKNAAGKDSTTVRVTRR